MPSLASKRLRAAWDVLTGKAEARHPVEDPGAVAAVWEELQPTLEYAWAGDGSLLLVGLRGGVVRGAQIERAVAARFPELTEAQQAELIDLIEADFHREQREEAREARAARRSGRTGGGWMNNHLKRPRHMLPPERPTRH